MKEVIVKLKKRHPANKMRLGSHVITNEWQKIKLVKDEKKGIDEEKILNSPEAKVWFKLGKEENLSKQKKVIEAQADADISDLLGDEDSSNEEKSKDEKK